MNPHTLSLLRPRRVSLLALSAAAALTIPASAAGAATDQLVGGGSFVRSAPFIDGSIYTLECHALAPGAVTTTVDSCYLTPDGPLTAPMVTDQGSAAFTEASYSSNPDVQYTLCWTVSATYSDGSAQSSSGCTSPSNIAGAG